MANVPKIKYLSKEEIETKALSLHPNKSLLDFPFDIEIYLTKEHGYMIAPSSNLEGRCKVDTALITCKKLIRIDQQIYDNQYRRACFSMAHELGHLILHKKYISYIENKLRSCNKTDEYKPIINNSFLEDKSYHRAELQADLFAGAILAPKDFLKESMLHLIQERKTKNKSDKLSDNDRDIICNDLSHQFGISKLAVPVRINKAELEYLFYI